MKLKHYEHVDINAALGSFKPSQKLRVYTINFTYATENGKTDYDKFHSNIYETDLDKLVKWIRDTKEVAEDIYKIEII